MKDDNEKKYVGDSRIEKSEIPPDTTPNDYSEYPGKTEAFWPNFLLKEWMVAAVFLVGFLAFVAAKAAPLEAMADPANTNYIPLPDWYFLFLYQLLKFAYASGPYMVVGTIIIPTIAFLGLLLVPFFDRKPERSYKKRIFPITFMLLAVSSIFYLTWDAARNEDWEAIAEQGEISQNEVDKTAPGYQVYVDNSCASCHGDSLQGGAGPNLVETQKTEEEISDIAKNGTGNMPPGMFKGTDEELNELASFVKSQGNVNN